MIKIVLGAEAQNTKPTSVQRANDDYKRLRAPRQTMKNDDHRDCILGLIDSGEKVKLKYKHIDIPRMLSTLAVCKPNHESAKLSLVCLDASCLKLRAPSSIYRDQERTIQSRKGSGTGEDIATHLLKLGCPGVWLLGAALLPCGGVAAAMGGARAAARLWVWSMEAIWLMGMRL